jgi:hypothetical protein
VREREMPLGKDDMGKRFAIVIGVAVTGVMALGAHTTAAAPEVVEYRTHLTINTAPRVLWGCPHFGGQPLKTDSRSPAASRASAPSTSAG